MKLIVGLGNPGNIYALARHNIGFIVLDYIAEYLKCEFRPGKGEYFSASAMFKNVDFVLLKPATFMNNSGLAIQEFLELYPGIKFKDILIVLDDFQLKLGTLRIREKGTDGGHNGMANVIYHLNSINIPRMRVGIGKGEVLKKDEFVDFVLSNFTENEFDKIKTLLSTYKDCILSFINEPFENVMNIYNKNYFEEENEKPEEREQ